jgi:hypothetical protein
VSRFGPWRSVPARGAGSFVAFPCGSFSDVVVAYVARLRGCRDETMSCMSDVAARTAEAIEVLRRHGAVFAYLHGSRATDMARPTSDVDIAAYFGRRGP